ncbi:formylglycine-generating enzyme family protein [Leucobacter manosquensis]|uniref:SUMF1/EgtB/PvdO family nonheme iron enzyme n=1 Tax=Leucobacter manosquensis TaxID=2810611 RepID=A0ABS5M5I5_9MICO|nr:SUMF1/EgtB/PvdO family nonheme iron enzyme [Leucobacter manosquensis]MBS3182417.1 SUMF1/EgtB/PvdO family nonheme iron enzyme [Leucobacter manosquensis]
MDVVSIPGGTVTLKDARRSTERSVALLPFMISAVPVRAREFDPDSPDTSRSAGPDSPASGVRWLDAIAWCNSASNAEGLEMAYTTNEGAVRRNATADGYRLPTEAEWVYASMGGQTRPRYGELIHIGWTALDGVDGPQPVGDKTANGFGLFDTIGNVWEWCWDRVDPARYADYRLLQGGGWADPEWSCRVGVRRGNAPDAIVEDVGFRVARGRVAQGADINGGQGWSEASDRNRADVARLLSLGWTPLKSD